MHYSSENLHRSHYRPPLDRLYNLCSACGNHWDQGTKPTCGCRRASSRLWATHFISSIPAFDVAIRSSGRRTVSPPLTYDQPMMPAVEPPPLVQSYSGSTMDSYSDGDYRDPFSATSPVIVRAAPPPQSHPPPPFHPQLAAPIPLRPYPSYPLSGDELFARPPPQASPVPPLPQLYHNANYVPAAQAFYADPDKPFPVNEDMYYRYDPLISRYIPAPEVPISYIIPGDYYFPPPAHLGLDT